MNLSRKSGMLAATGHGIRGAFSWRLILLWILFLAIPTLLVAMPQWRLLMPMIGYSVDADSWASTFNVPAIGDLIMAIGRRNGSPVPGSGTALLLTLLLSPLLTGMLVTQIRQGGGLGFRELIQGGIAEYGRLFRLLLVSIIPMGIAFGIAAAGMSAAGDAADEAIYAADADFAKNLAMIFGGIVLLLAHSTVEAGRAYLAMDGRLRSAFRAWWRGLKLLLRRPVATLGVYLLTTIISLLAALLFITLRVNVSAAGIGGFVLAMLLTQLIVASLVWGRIARLGGISRLADAPRR
ncbi:MAG: hypothetical protein KDI75_01615 [Xanthomonadales bacterium]|nr:hypothetical protein [Xanthomonadales bacterium]